MSFSEVAQFFLDSFPTLRHTREEIMAEWTDMAHERYVKQAPLKDGVYDFILEMKRQGKKLGIATSNGRTLVDDTRLAWQDILMW